MDKKLKSELAKTFAPQLRFNQKIKKEEDFIPNPTKKQRKALKKILESDQNKTEKYPPSSVEYFSKGMIKASNEGKNLRLRLIVRKKGIRFKDSSDVWRDRLDFVYDFETTGLTPTASSPKWKVFSVRVGQGPDSFEVSGRYLVTDIPSMKIRTGKPPEELEFRPTDVISKEKPEKRKDGDNHFWSYIVGYKPFPGQEEAPTYYHILPQGDSTAGDVEKYHIQYFFLYPYDTKSINRINSHRSDWEHVGFDVERNPTTRGVRITKGYFYGHGHVLGVPPDEIEFVEGTHPVVYVAQGSHASYPKAGIAFDWRLITWFPDLSDMFRQLADRQYDDIFTGLGLKLDGWKNLVDLGEGASRIEDKTTKGFRVDESQRQGPAWLDYPGYWGPDLDPETALDTGIIDIDVLSGRSARGPIFKAGWDDPLDKEVEKIDWEPESGVIWDEFSDFSGICFFPKV